MQDDDTAEEDRLIEAGLQQAEAELEGRAYLGDRPPLDWRPDADATIWRSDVEDYTITELTTGEVTLAHGGETIFAMSVEWAQMYAEIHRILGGPPRRSP